MFDFFNSVIMAMINSYEQRKVDNFKCNEFEIDTAEVYDRSQRYETAIAHKDFNGGQWIILEWSDTKEEAQKIHNKWVEHFKNNDISEIEDARIGVIFMKR